MAEIQQSLGELHRIYKGGNLRILAGAGVSKFSDFPDWDSLNKRILNAYLAPAPYPGESSDSHTAPTVADSLTEAVYKALGRDGVAELVLKSSTAKGNFFSRLALALYRDRPLDNLYLSDLQRQIAGLTLAPGIFSQGDRITPRRTGQSIANIYTTNFDPLLEMAISLACYEGNVPDVDKNPAASFRQFRLPLGSSDDPVPGSYPQVTHLHGWVDPGGEAGGQVVYAESHYFSLQNSRSAEANVQTEDLFSKTGATVILGMSLTDPNLRRLLYARSAQPVTNSAAFIYSFMRRGESELVDRHASKFWRLLNVELISYREHSELPGLIRQIQWGPSNFGEPPNWFQSSAAFTKLQLQAPGSEKWFKIAAKLLPDLRNQIDRLYVTQAREKIGLALFAPSVPASGSAEPFIHEIGSVSTNGDFEAANVDTLVEAAESRKLDIRAGNVQGLAGLAFVEGAIKEANARDSGGLDLNFTDKLLKAFDKGTFRDWRSMIAVPILGGPFWIPLGVICLTSNFGEPFWEALRLDSSEFFGFSESLLKAGRLLLIKPKPGAAADLDSSGSTASPRAVS